MQESVVIDEAGHAHFHYTDSNACQNPCSMADMPYSTLDFVLASVSNGVSSASVAASSGTRNKQVGQSVTVILKPQPFGQAIGWTIGGKDEGLFCEHAIATWCGGFSNSESNCSGEALAALAKRWRSDRPCVCGL
jgi:hypothetical protein